MTYRPSFLWGVRPLEELKPRVLGQKEREEVLEQLELSEQRQLEVRKEDLLEQQGLEEECQQKSMQETKMRMKRKEQMEDPE
jgi:hypothetical protein